MLPTGIFAKLSPNLNFVSITGADFMAISAGVFNGLKGRAKLIIESSPGFTTCGTDDVTSELTCFCGRRFASDPRNPTYCGKMFWGRGDLTYLLLNPVYFEPSRFKFL